MTSERWKKIEELYHSAVQLDAGQRAAFLEEACGEDTSLRKEVESLLGFHEKADNFIEMPAVEVAAKLEAHDPSGALVGRVLGHYKVLALIGAGGMGEVYLAHDSRLGRKIALKLLPAHFSSDESRLRRFEQEARAASALNHPNIVTIYEIGQVDHLPFIATELIEGETLRELLSRERIQPREALDVAIQVAGALAAAHEAGIVHRDIKPENIMRRRDGYLKVLDFGLAKLAERPSPPANATGPAPPAGITEPGLIMGTVSYMSPEQLRGLQVDSRTDIFSLGVVLYEILTGTVPFAGDTSADRIASILYKDPPPLGWTLPEVSEELEWSLTKALAKDREERYQDIKDFLLDLKRIKKRLEFEAELQRKSVSDSGGKPIPSTSGARAPLQKPGIGEPQTGNAEAEPAASTLKPPAAKRTAFMQPRNFIGGLLILAAAIIILHRFVDVNRSERTGPAPFERISIQKLTATGKVAVAAISRDGKYVAYAMEESGQRSLWVLQLASSTNLQIVQPSDVEYWGLTFSPDGNYIYYIAWQWNAPDVRLCKVPVLGGNPKTVLPRVGSPITFSNDGEQFAFTDGSSAKGESWLMVADSDGTETRTLATRRTPSYFCEYVLGPAWSPDGRIIASAAGNSDNEGLYRNLVGVRAQDGRETLLTTDRWYDFSGIGWLEDGKGIAVAANLEISSPMQLWLIPFPKGAATRITTDADDYRGISLTGDSSTIATVQTFRTSNIWTVPEGDANRAKRITSEASVGSSMEGISWTPEGRIVYRFSTGRSQDLWLMKPDGSDRKQLTEGARNNIHPVVSPDGGHIVFVSDRAGNLNVWRMDIDGSNAKQLTNGSSEVFPTCSPDGKWVVYQRGYGYDSRQTLWKVPIDGGEPVEITNRMSRGPVFSPDGKSIAFFQLDEEGWGLAVIRFDTGALARRFKLPVTVASRVVRWAPDGKGLAYIENREGVSNIWVQPLDIGSPRQLTDFRTDQIFDFDWSRDGTQLACSRGTVTSDVVLIRDINR